jgi:hypothetical protein
MVHIRFHRSRRPLTVHLPSAPGAILIHCLQSVFRFAKLRAWSTVFLATSILIVTSVAIPAGATGGPVVFYSWGEGNNAVSKATGTTVTDVWASAAGTGSATGVASDGNYVYWAKGKFIYRSPIDAPNSGSGTLFSTLDNFDARNASQGLDIAALATDATHLYAMGVNSRDVWHWVLRVSLSDGLIDQTWQWDTKISNGFGLSVSEDYVFASGNSTVRRATKTASNGAPTASVVWINGGIPARSGLFDPQPIANDGTYLYYPQEGTANHQFRRATMSTATIGNGGPFGNSQRVMTPFSGKPVAIAFSQATGEFFVGSQASSGSTHEIYKFLPTPFGDFDPAPAGSAPSLYQSFQSASGSMGGMTVIPAPAAISPATQTVSGTVGTAIAASTGFTASNFSGAVTYSSETLPAGLTLDINTGVISGTPTAVSTATVTITATGATSGTATATVTFAISAAPTPPAAVVIVELPPETTAPPTTTAPTTTAPGNVPTLVSADNQTALTREPGSATALVNGQPVEVEVLALADSAGAQTAPEDRTPEQVAELQQAAEAVAERLAAVAGGDIGIEVIATDTGAELSGVFPDRNVPVEDVIVVDVGESATLFAARSASGDIIEVQPGAVLEVTPEGEVAVIAYGLPVGDQVELVLMSTPTLLGTFIVDANGAIETLANIPDAIGSGDHTLVVASPNVQASLGLKVSDLTGSGVGAQPSERTLPAAGSSPANGLVIILLAMGGLLVLAARRRREMVID